MADKHIYIDDSPKNPDLKTSPFDWTYTTNLTGRFGKVNCAMMKYLPPHTKLKVKPYFAFDMHPLVFPVQTNIRCHLKFYKVPLRILWKDFEDFASQIGTNGLPTNGGGTQFVVPYIKRETGWNAVGSLAEQIGCCNQKLSSYVANQSVPGYFYRAGAGSGNQFLSLDDFGLGFGDFSFVAKLPISAILHPNSDGALEDTFMRISWLQSTNAAVSGARGFIVQALKYGRQRYTYTENASSPEQVRFNNGFEIIASTSITNSSDTTASYNSSSASTTYSTIVSSALSINDNNVFVGYCFLKLVDESFINAVNAHLAEDETIFIRLVPTGSFKSILFPDSYNPPKPSYITHKYCLTKQVNDSVTYDDKTAVLVQQLGMLPGCTMGLEVVTSTIDTKFDSIEGADPQIPIPALPFRALEFIHNYFMRNPRIDPFVKDGVPTYNRFLTNDGSGADATTPVDSWNALYESDYFTTCVKEPQFGNAPLVGATVNDTSTTGILTFGDGSTFDNYVVKLNADAEGNVAPLSVYPENADKPTMDRLNELINFGISINDLRNVSTFQRMLERMQRTSYRFANVVYEFFGTNPPVGDHYPQYLGGVSRNVTVDKITNIAETEGHPLGSFAGQGKFRGEGESISVFTTEPCYLVCIQYFTVTPTYSQYLPKHLLYKNPLDFYMNPEFAFMGPQPVYKGEIAPNQVTADHFYDVFGYNRPYAELFGNVDEVHGLYKTEMANFLLQRFFGTAPELNKSFIEINSADLTNIFAYVKNTDKLFGQILFKGTSQLPAPRSYLPRSI